MATAPQSAMEMPQQGKNPFSDPNTMAIYDQIRQTVSPQEFTNEMLAGASQVDPQAVAEFTQELQGLDMPPEVLDALNDVVDEILANPEQYAQLRAKYIAQDLPEDILPEQFDPEFFAALNMAIDQMIAAPTGVQAFAKGGIAELKPIAKAIASYGRNGDTMLAHITPAEARMLRRRGGSGTTNPDTGLPEFFLKKLFKGVSKALKSVGNAVKKFAKSTVGRIVTTVALGFFLGPAAASLLGASSAAGVAAISGFVGSAGSTLLGGGNLKDALKAGAVGGLTAGAGAGLMGGADAFASNSYSGAGLTPSQALERQVGTFKDAIGMGGPPVVDMAPTSQGTFGQDPTAAVGPNTAPTPYNDLKMTGTPSKPFPEFFENQVPPSAQFGPGDPGAGFEPVMGTGPKPPSIMDTAKDFYNKNISPSGIQETGAKNALAKVQSQFPGVTAEQVATAPASSVLGKAYASAMPGTFASYAPAVGAGLGIIGLAGGFDSKPVQGGAITNSLQTSAADRMRKEGTQRENYMQNLPGVVYDDKGEPLYGQATPFPKYKSPGFAPTPGEARTLPIEPPPLYAPPKGALTNSPGGIAQPYNNSNMYSNLMYPNREVRTYADGGGIAALGSGGYPRRTGQISGPGTEKSDSIPAMLSDGEFVMTASAVRGAGKGDRRAGAKRMYKLMHQLEKNSKRG